MTFSWPIRVYWEDTDAGGVVYHARYLHFFERARTEWLRSAGISQTALREQQDVILVVKDVYLDILRPARFDDALIANVSMGGIGRASFTTHQELWRGSECLSKADVKIACLKASSFKPSGLPDDVRQALHSAQKN
ncbi:MAG: tol-pal system-associated acyl-CoA thioesterase [Arenimonas sp.]